MDRLRRQLFKKSYATVSMGVSLQRRSFRELACFLRSSEGRTFATSQTAAEHELSLFHRTDPFRNSRSE
jgi:hypothetical protein